MPQARALQKDEAEQLGEEAQALHELIVSALSAGRVAMWAMAEALYAFDEKAHWLSLGHDTLGEWLAQPEITMTRRTYNRLIRAWHQLHVLRKLDQPTLADLDLSKVDIVLPALERGHVDQKQALVDIRKRSAQDLRDKYQRSGGHGDESDDVIDVAEVPQDVRRQDNGGAPENVSYPYWEELRDALLQLLDKDRLRKELAAVALPAIREVDQALGLE